MKVGEALVRLLEAYGVDTVFGIPGTHSVELYRGLSASRIRHLSPRHEQGGGFMADGYARATGKPGVCFVITGPGVTNIATPMAGADIDSVPLLVISPINTPDAARLNRGRLHEITDQAAVTAPFTAFSATARGAAEIPGLVHRAFALFASERPRPVHISVPLAVLAEELDDIWRPLRLPGRPGVGPAQREQSLALLQAAKQPVILAGGGARFDAPAVMQLAERLAAPVITTVAGRGIAPADHPLSAGATLRAGCSQRLLANADLAILLGTELAQPDHYNDALRLPALQIRVNLNQDTLYATDQTLGVRAAIATWIEEMLAATADWCMADRSAAEARVAVARATVDAALTVKNRRHLAVWEQLMVALPSGAPIVTDMTQLAYTAVEYLPLDAANRWTHPTGYGPLGYALPAAIGRCVAEPGSPVLCVAGDAGVQYTLQEMTLASELALPLVLLLWDDAKLQQIEDDMLQAGFEPLAIEQRNPDFAALGEACGWRTERVEQLAAIGPAITRAFAAPGPVLLILDGNRL